MDKKAQLLKLFQANARKTVIAAPKATGPAPRYWGSGVKVYWE